MAAMGLRFFKTESHGVRAEFDAKLEAAAPISAAVRSVVAHLTEAPLNFHQTTVMYAAERSGDGEKAR